MPRFFKLMVMCLCVVTLTAHDAEAARRKKTKSVKPRAPVSAGINDARYAALIMNPQTGEIYHQANANERRYPASLTKMMTLYLLFEALENKKTTLGAHLDVSEYAASMPQTNLALEEGDSIPVEIAIKALVVRSANDVSVVVAEALGGDVEHFAQMMTAKARTLGMKNTVFQNPNGLPNNMQYTTARDMAKLGIALKRDFPKYYPYFATRQFSWNGATYYTHNRVMLRYPGTDGIKTGFIGASGFNLVTSVTRGGRPLVGVVLGGSSGAWRDNRMIQLLDESYKIVASRGADRGKLSPENLPLGKNGKTIGTTAQTDATVEANAVKIDAATVDDDATGIPSTTETAEEDADVAPIHSASVAAAKQPSPYASRIEFKPVVKTQPAVPTVVVTTAPPSGPQVVTVPTPPAQASLNAQRAPVANTPFVHVPTTPPAMAAPKANAASAWGIQVGAFSSNDLATRAVQQAMQLAPTQLAGATPEIAGPENNGAPVHRARIVNLSELHAKAACEKLIANNTPCFIFKSGN